MMGTVIIVFHLCMLTTCLCTCIGVYKGSQSITESVHKESSLMPTEPTLTQDIYCLQCEHPAKPLAMLVYATYLCNVLNFIADPQLHVAYGIAGYYFCLELWSV